MASDRSLRVAFLGNDPWSVPALHAVGRSHHLVVAVVTSVPKPAGRGNQLRPTAVALAAREIELPLVEVETVKTGAGFKALAATSPDALAVVAYGEILPPNVLHLPRVAPVNLHFSLLPELRGAAPVQTALLIGLEETGVTTILMDHGVDSGPVILQRTEPIDPEDDAGSLGARLAEVGGAVLVETLDMVAAGPVAPVQQDPRLATYAPKLRPDDRVLDWSHPADVLVNLVRALAPEPGAITAFRGRTLKVLRAETADAQGDPGTVREVSKGGFVVAAGQGGLRPLVLAPAGRAAMAARDFVNGFRPQPGERLG